MPRFRVYGLRPVYLDVTARSRDAAWRKADGATGWKPDGRPIHRVDVYTEDDLKRRRKTTRKRLLSE